MIEYWKKHKWAIIAFGAFGVFLVILPWAISQHYSGISFNDTGQIGDTIGGLTAPFISFLAAILVYLAFKAQIDANKAIQEQFKIQQFEDKFYTMLELHRQNVSEFTIEFADIEEFDPDMESPNPIPIKKRDVAVKGREIFETMIWEILSAIEKLRALNVKNKLGLSNEEIVEYAYQFFHYGTDSAGMLHRIRKKPWLEELNDILKEESYHFSHRNNYGYGDDDRDWLYSRFKYPPYKGHTTKLPQYFRQLYHTIKLIHRYENENLIKEKQSLEYLKILRAQLSNSEQFLIYLNYRYGFGKRWDHRGSDEHRFLTKYKMIHNIPFDRFPLEVESPRKHFKEYIANIESERDPLFQQGDFD